MSPAAPNHDQDLLQRLNALKGTSVTLSHDAGPNPSSSEQLQSRDAALTARLRTLRNRSPSASGSTPPPQSRSTSANVVQPAPGHADIDAALSSGDAALDEFLENLELDPDVDEGLAQWDVEAETSKAADLLERLQRIRSDQQPGEQAKEDPDSDSDGEETAIQVARILSQLRDEATLHPNEPAEAGEAHNEDSSKETGTQQSSGQPVEAGLSLPTVPSELADPVYEDESTRKSLDFENDITVRLAALKGLGSGINTDQFGLPAAPTFQPEDRPVRGVAKRPGYTDADQKSWCVACLEDATVRCIGCDDDVYCARCFKDMHIGPRAGYEERGHKWVKYERT